MANKTEVSYSRRQVLDLGRQAAQAVVPFGWLPEVALRRGFTDLSTGAKISLAKDFGLLVVGSQAERNLQDRLFNEVEALPDGTTKGFIQSGIAKYFSSRRIKYGDISVPIVEPRVRYIDAEYYGNTSFSPHEFDPSQSSKVTAFKPEKEVTVQIPLEFIGTKDELTRAGFPSYSEHPTLGSVPLVPVGYLPEFDYHSYVNPSISIGRLSETQFIRLALIKEAASMALMDALINHVLSVMRDLNLPTTISAINTRSGEPFDVEILTNAIFRIMSQGSRTPALIDIAGYGVAIDAVRDDMDLITLARSAARDGTVVDQTSLYDFGQSPDKVMTRAFEWVVNNPYSRGFHHVKSETMDTLP